MLETRVVMGPDDLGYLEELLSGASAVIAMRDVYAGNHEQTVIALRHDVDDNAHSLSTAVTIARWEAERGYRSTFYFLHGASYWTAERLGPAVQTIASLGHEVGIHANAIAEALRTGRDPDELLSEALVDLRAIGVPVIGVAGHGDRLCRQAGFVSDEQFVECRRPDMGPRDRTIEHNGVTVKLDPKPLAFFGLEYETLRLPRGHYQSDSGGTWCEPMAETIDGFPFPNGQLHILQHPDWWAAAFDTERVAA